MSTHEPPLSREVWSVSSLERGSTLIRKKQIWTRELKGNDFPEFAFVYMKRNNLYLLGVQLSNSFFIDRTQRENLNVKELINLQSRHPPWESSNSVPNCPILLNVSMWVNSRSRKFQTSHQCINCRAGIGQSCDKKLMSNLAAEVDKRRFMGLLNSQLCLYLDLGFGFWKII